MRLTYEVDDKNIRLNFNNKLVFDLFRWQFVGFIAVE